jgi:hypothetical protein
MKPSITRTPNFSTADVVAQKNASKYNIITIAKKGLVTSPSKILYGIEVE